MRKKQSSHALKITTIVLVSIIALSAIIYALDAWNQGWKVLAGSGSKKVVTIYDQVTRYQITNTLTKAIFVPTKTQAEWDAFQANKPSGVTSCKTENGGWTSWTCGTCSNPCNSLNKCSGTTTGSRTCTKTCTQPSPTCGGLACSGSSSKTESCSVTCTSAACGSGEYCSSGSCINCPTASSIACESSISVSGCGTVWGTKPTCGQGKTCKTVSGRTYCTATGV